MNAIDDFEELADYVAKKLCDAAKTLTPKKWRQASRQSRQYLANVETALEAAKRRPIAMNIPQPDFFPELPITPFESDDQARAHEALHQEHVRELQEKAKREAEEAEEKARQEARTETDTPETGNG